MPAHVDFGASSAERWFKCGRSIQHLKDNPLPPTEDAVKGTSLASLCEMMWNDADSLEAWDYPEDDWSAATAYCEIISDCVKRVESEKGKVATVNIEKQIIIWIDGVMVGGTPDAQVYAHKGQLHTIDMKRGFEDVSVIDNKQELVYDQAVCIDSNVQPTSVYHHIYQPNSLGADWKTVEVPLKELIDFRKELYARVAQIKAKPEYLSGDHCGWCNKVECPEWMSKTTEVTGMDLTQKDNVMPDISKMNTERLLRVRAAMPLINRMSDEVSAMLFKRAMGGEKIPLHKLTAKQKNRSWISEKAVVKLFGKKVIVKTESVMSPAQIEKNFDENVDDLTERKENGYKLVARAADGIEYVPGSGFENDEDLEKEQK